MKKDNSIIIFNQKQVRRAWDEEKELWYFSVVDVIEILTESPRPRKYWNALKTKLDSEGSELSQKMGRLKMRAQDGKMRITDVLDTENILRLIQSIPSPKAEPLRINLESHIRLCIFNLLISKIFTPIFDQMVKNKQ
jgi:hypothetical protein